MRPKRRAWKGWSLGGALLLALAGGACSTGRMPHAGSTAVPAPTPRPEVAARPLVDWPDAVLYFAIVDRFADGDLGNDQKVDRGAKGTFHGGDLAGLRTHLDEIADLGVTALWITPVVKNIDGFVTGAGFPDWAYHGYWADDFTRLDPRFGSEEDLKGLVADCHRRGIRVLLDVVYNHAGYGSHYLTDPRTKGWLRNEETGSCGQDDVTSCVAGLPDFRTELPEVADYLMTAHLSLAKRVGLDGFRLDTVKHVGHPFWDEHRRRSRLELGPGFFLLGEVWGGDAQSLEPWFASDEMDAGFDFGFQGSTLGWIQGRGRTVAFDHYLKSRERVHAGHFLAQFLSSHDVPGALYQLHGDKQLFRLAVVLQMTTVGIPTIYYGEEVARPGGDWPDNRSDMPWGDRAILPGEGQPRDEALRADYRRLIAIRAHHRALSRGVHQSLASDGDLLVFEQRDAASGDVVVVVVNRGAESAVARFAPPSEWAGKPARDAWGGAPVRADGGRLAVEIAPRAAAIVATD